MRRRAQQEGNPDGPGAQRLDDGAGQCLAVRDRTERAAALRDQHRAGEGDGVHVLAGRPRAELRLRGEDLVLGR
ncbi:hypothetical protein [Streptomyces heilongjiangensis]|uniref:Uncharacterized protein n=1 Tax=Streptomyces heilongjiangensis TaxID=945052 RepID=A0ABW1BIV4_9ACTN|nr:hypothetical protein [Streptomyces heilongjiangensis]MDC2951955.1 hypothetical protein [Streptomyces heilongjiangensis]